MKGEVIVDCTSSEIDNRLFEMWHENLLENRELEDIVRNEVHCRVGRLEKSGTKADSMQVSSYDRNKYDCIERIAKAQHRLLFSSDPVSTIAYDVGYDTLSSFNRAFKKMTSLTPRTYRSEMMVER